MAGRLLGLLATLPLLCLGALAVALVAWPLLVLVLLLDLLWWPVARATRRRLP